MNTTVLNETIFKEQIKELMVEQSTLEFQKKTLAERQAAFDTQNEDLLTRIKDTITKIDKLKEYLSIAAVDNFKATKSKSFLGGIAVREYSKMDYKDDTALSWAKDHNMCLMLDVKAFEKLVEAEAFPIVFVKRWKEPKATFPKQLTL